MLALLTWPAYGTWFARSARGWIDRDCAGPLRSVPEPRRSAPERLKWPAVALETDQRALIVRDLPRIASLREFDARVIAVAPDHVHMLLSCRPDREVPRLVQLIKGSLSRTLTAAGGDEQATTPRGGPLRHHKWWSRQYSFRWIDDDEVRIVLDCLRAHEEKGAMVWIEESLES